MNIEILNFLKSLTKILEEGGPYAGWSLFIVLWLLERRYSKKLTDQLRNFAMTQVEASVETRMTLGAVKEVLSQISNAQILVWKELSNIRAHLDINTENTQNLLGGRDDSDVE